MLRTLRADLRKVLVIPAGILLPSWKANDASPLSRLRKGLGESFIAFSPAIEACAKTSIPLRHLQSHSIHRAPEIREKNNR